MKIERRFLLLIGVSNQSGHQVNDEVDHTAMSRVLNLANVFELVIDSLAQRSLAQKYFVKHRHQFVFHILLDLRNQLDIYLPELSEEFFRNVAAKSLPQSCCARCGTGLRSSML